MTLAEPSSHGSGLRTPQHAAVTLERYNSFETMLKMDSNIQADGGAVSLMISTELDNELWTTACGLVGGTGASEVPFTYCDVWYAQEQVFVIRGPSVAHDTWHTVRIEVNPASSELRFFIDGEPDR